MTCKCHGSKPQSASGNKTAPVEPCLYCAEKHLATAAVLAREQGYSGVNRGWVVGELEAACLHLSGHPDPAARDLSAALRDFRHRIQSRTEDEARTDFSPHLAEIDALIREDMRAKMETEATP